MNTGQNMATLWERKINIDKRCGEFHRRLKFLLGKDAACIIVGDKELELTSVAYHQFANPSIQIFVVYLEKRDGFLGIINEISFRSVSRHMDFRIQGADDVFMVETVIEEHRMRYLEKRAEEIDSLVEELQDSDGQFGFDEIHNGILQAAIFDLMSAAAKIKALNIKKDE
jgi:hypothetical protein